LFPQRYAPSALVARSSDAWEQPPLRRPTIAVEDFPRGMKSKRGSRESRFRQEIRVLELRNECDLLERDNPDRRCKQQFPNGQVMFRGVVQNASD